MSDPNQAKESLTIMLRINKDGSRIYIAADDKRGGKVEQTITFDTPKEQVVAAYNKALVAIYTTLHDSLDVAGF